MRHALTALALAGSTTLLACAGAPPPPPRPPAPAPPPAETTAMVAPAPPPAPPADPFAIPKDLREEPASTMTPVVASLTLQPYPAAPAGLPKPPVACNAFVKRAAVGKAPVCKERPAALDALDAALAETDEATRDGRLVALEGCAGLPVGIVRALRADLAPAQCGDVLVEALVDKPPKALTSAVYNTLLGQALAGRMARLGYDAPKVSAPYDKPHLLEHMTGPFKAWLVMHAQAIQSTSDVAARLSFYGRAIAAVSQDPTALRLLAIDPVRIKRIGFGLSIATAALAGAFLIVIQPVEPSVGREYIGRIFAICVLGGMGSLPGTLIGAILLGIVESITTTFFGPSWAPAVGFGFLLATLAFRPTGLLGR